MYRGKPQRYGSQTRANPETGVQEVYPVEDPEYVNQRRAAVGLGPIEPYLERFGIEWTVPQQERPTKD